MAKIEHVFVLMLENRSLDHFFGLSGLVPPPPAQFGFGPGALDRLKTDPPHEYDDVAKQVAGGAMTGFPAASGPDAMKGFSPSEIPVLTALAENYLLMDNWFSSMPGPTWPNRLFAHAGSSGGLDNSMSVLGANSAITDPTRCMQFDNSHIFDHLTGAGKTWRVYQGDRFPQVLSLRGMVEASDYNQRKQFFRPLTDLVKDLKGGDAANYTWIEPKYGIFDSFKSGNSQHPLGSVNEGESLIRIVYNAVRSSPKWESSVLLVLWDEHGGFFDHASPPPSTPPGDRPWNRERAAHPKDCKFDRFGPRIPAVLISPWLPQGLGSKIFPGKIFDHSSIVASLRDTFGLGTSLTSRDKNAPSWSAALLRSKRALEIGTLRQTAKTRTEKASPSIPARRSWGAPSGSLLGFSQIAYAVDWQVARQTATAPLAESTHKANLKKAHALLTTPAISNISASTAHRLLVQYMIAVDEKAALAEKSARKPSVRRRTTADSQK
jgi:phospholipase C